ncbi:hypothetical protein U1Q18_020269 [Sarracenia purpurea var. burkii]
MPSPKENITPLKGSEIKELRFPPGTSTEPIPITPLKKDFVRGAEVALDQSLSGVSNGQRNVTNTATEQNVGPNLGPMDGIVEDSPDKDMEPQSPNTDTNQSSSPKAPSN